MTRIVTHNEGTEHYTSTWLEYAKNDVAVTFISGEQWDWNGQAGYPVTNYQIDYVREFWYDGPRQRYANRLLDLQQLMDDGLIVPLSTIWSDYDGDTIYGDYTIDYDPTVLTNTVSYEPGMAKTLDPLGTSEALYYHADHLGTTRGLSDESVAWVQESAYSAFGEITGGDNHRYGYVGKEGYQAHEEFPFLHVGWRYYDPSVGRFLARDPSGIEGGENVYEYVRSSPMKDVDPSGLRTDMGLDEPPGGYPGPKPNPEGTPEPPLLPDIYLACTGGLDDPYDSWLDDPAKVKTARKALRVPWLVTSVALLPYGVPVKIILGTASGLANQLAPS